MFTEECHKSNKAPNVMNKRLFLLLFMENARYINSKKRQNNNLKKLKKKKKETTRYSPLISYLFYEREETRIYLILLLLSFTSQPLAI